MKHIFKYIILFVFFASIAATAGDTHIRYQVKKGDQLGFILSRLNICPLWGVRGSVQQVVRLNNTLKATNGELLLPGEELVIPIGTSTQERQSLSKCEKCLGSVENCMSRKPVGEKSLWSSKLKTSPENSLSSRKIASPEMSKVTNDLVKTNRSYPSTLWSGSRLTHSQVILRGNINFRKVEFVDNSTGAKGKVISDANIGLGLDLWQVWSEHFRTVYSLSYEQIKYSDSVTRSWEAGSKTLFDGGIGAEWDVLGWWSLAGRLGLGEEYFVFAPSTLTLRLDKAPLLKGELSSRVRVIQLGTWTSYLEIGTKWISAGDVQDYKAKSSTGFNFAWGGTYFFGENNSWLTKGWLQYEQMTQNTDTFDQVHFRFNYWLGVGRDF